jgi:hypothetical protein
MMSQYKTDKNAISREGNTKCAMVASYADITQVQAAGSKFRLPFTRASKSKQKASRATSNAPANPSDSAQATKTQQVDYLPDVNSPAGMHDLQHASRKELLQMLVIQSKRIDYLEAENQRLTYELSSRKIKIQNAGSIAEAALSLSGIFEAAESASEQYLQNLYDLVTLEEQTLARLTHKEATLDNLISDNLGKNATQLNLDAEGTTTSTSTSTLHQVLANNASDQPTPLGLEQKPENSLRGGVSSEAIALAASSEDDTQAAASTDAQASSLADQNASQDTTSELLNSVSQTKCNSATSSTKDTSKLTTATSCDSQPSQEASESATASQLANAPKAKGGE